MNLYIAKNIYYHGFYSIVDGTRYLGTHIGNIFYNLSKDDEYIIDYIKNNFNPLLSDHGIFLFKNETDAKCCLEYIEPLIILNKIIGDL